jgi:hypothetical protein
MSTRLAAQGSSLAAIPALEPDLSGRQKEQTSSPQAGSGLMKLVRRYFPATRHTTSERVLGVLLAIVAVLVLAGLIFVLLGR